METIRSFIAIELSQEIRTALNDVTTNLTAHTRFVRWVPAENIHLTLIFLGEIPRTTLALLNKSLQSAVLPLKPFLLTVGKIGAFPSLRRPRVVWVGIQAPVELEILQKEVEMATIKLGLPVEERPYSPHLTIGRVNKHASQFEINILSNDLASARIGKLGTMAVRSIAIFQSELLPSGPIYTRLYEAKLSGINEVK